MNRTVIAQNNNWFVLSNSDGSVSVETIETDSDTNLFIGGKFKKTLELHSTGNTDTTKTLTENSRDQSLFFTKLNSQGVVQFAVWMKNNSQYADAVQKIISLKNGKTLVIISCRSDISIYGPEKGAEQVIPAHEGTLLLVFDKTGHLNHYKHLKISRVKDAFETHDRQLFLLGYPINFNYNKPVEVIYKIDPNLTAADPLEIPVKGVNRMIFHDGKIWILNQQKPENIFYSYTYQYTLYQCQPSAFQLNLTQVFQKKFGYLQRSKGFLTVEKNELKIALFAKDPGPDTITYDQQKFPLHDRQSAIFVLNEKGGLENHIHFSSINAHVDFIGLSSGGYILQTSCYDSLKINNSKAIPVTPHSSFVYELAHLHLDEDLSPINILSSGGIPSSYANALIKERNNQLFIASDLHDFGHFDFGYRELVWKEGFYLRRIDLAK